VKLTDKVDAGVHAHMVKEFKGYSTIPVSRSAALRNRGAGRWNDAPPPQRTRATEPLAACGQVE